MILANSHKKQFENKSERDGRDKNRNRIKFVTTSKNFSKTFKTKEISLDIIEMFIKFYYLPELYQLLFLGYTDSISFLSCFFGDDLCLQPFFIM